MFANVPLAITSLFPLLLPYELKSFGLIPLSYKYLDAGDFKAILPAGDMWSVVIEFPKFNKQYASFISSMGLVSFDIS